MQKSNPARIQTSGVNKTTPGLQTRGTNIKTPVDIYGRTYRDPKSLDLVDIEIALDNARAEEKRLEIKLKAEIKAKKDAEKNSVIQAGVRAELAKKPQEEQK